MMTPTESQRYYLVRTASELVEKSIVGVGWSDHDFSSARNADEAIQAIDADYGIGRVANQVRRFIEIQEGDLIVAPLPYSVAIGRATGGLFFDPVYLNEDKANQRRIVFPTDASGQLVKLPRTAFSEAFQRRIRVRGITVNDLDEFRVEILQAYENVVAGKDFSWSLVMAQRVQKARDDFKTRLLGNIQSGNTNLQTGGIGLEHLVKELLQIEGYQAEVLSKQAFPGNADADVKASRVDPCATINLLVQVKHHQGFTNEYGLAQLEEIGKHDLPEYRDHALVFCTSASTSEAFLKRAEELEVAVIDGIALVDWIAQHIERLPGDSKNSLGICEVPTVLGVM